MERGRDEPLSGAAGPEPRGPGKPGPPRPADPPPRPCDLCGGAVVERHCKVVCLNCGYQRDCSDP